MRFNDYINKDLYISLLDKKEYEKPKNENVKRIVDELNRYTNCFCNQYKFTISNEFKSPSDVPLKLDEKKKERMVRLWMKKCEELEEVKKDLDKK